MILDFGFDQDLAIKKHRIQAIRSRDHLMAETEIIIVDYGMGNLRSVQKAFEKVGYHAQITQDPKIIAEAGRLVLPGVGAFKDAIAKIRSAGLEKPILDHLHSNKPFLGICLGMQLLFETGWEDGKHKGLGFYKGEVVLIPSAPGLKIPHMGWNQLTIVKDTPFLKGFPRDGSVYFVHSFYAIPKSTDILIATTDYPNPITAIVGEGNRVATQFHPEKSQSLGLGILKNFAELN